MLSYFYWDPPRDAFTLPIIHHPIAWYGILFAIGFFVSYLIVRKIFQEHLHDAKLATKFTDKLTLYIVIGTVVGARLVEVFFYSWPYYKEHPMAIFKVWEGGLASHGGALGIIIAIFYFCYRTKELKVLLVFDAVVIGASFTGMLIRLGNFINQEILGKITDLPWAVLFGHPVDDPAFVPRHPVQLYESFSCLLVFLLFIYFWKIKKISLGRGIYLGWFLFLIFSFRFFMEWLKMPQSEVFNESTFTMGQILSLPFIAAGLILIFAVLQKSSSHK